jgi:hypothetical protein
MPAFSRLHPPPPKLPDLGAYEPSAPVLPFELPLP